MILLFWIECFWDILLIIFNLFINILKLYVIDLRIMLEEIVIFQNSTIRQRNIYYALLSFLCCIILSLTVGYKVFRFTTATPEQKMLYLPFSAFLNLHTITPAEALLVRLQADPTLTKPFVQDFALLGLSTVRIPTKTSPVSRNARILKNFADTYPEYSTAALQQYSLLETTLYNAFNHNSTMNYSLNKSIQIVTEYITTVNRRLSPTRAQRIATAILNASERFSIPYPLLTGFIASLSSFNASHGTRNSVGLSQIQLYRWYTLLRSRSIVATKKSLTEIETNIMAGAYILRHYYTLATRYAHNTPVRYSLHRYTQSRDNTFVQKVYAHTHAVMRMAQLI